MKNVSQPSQEDLDTRSVHLPPSKHQKTLIFDLDETLVHCIDDIDNLSYDKKITVNFPTGEIVDAGVNIRPFAYDCLKKANQNY
jgi:CTD small phosphatase-like protein 2